MPPLTTVELPLLAIRIACVPPVTLPAVPTVMVRVPVVFETMPEPVVPVVTPLAVIDWLPLVEVTVTASAAAVTAPVVTVFVPRVAADDAGRAGRVDRRRCN